MPRSWLTSALVTALVVANHPVASYNTTVNYATDGGAQFVFYSGQMSGTFTHNKTKYDNDFRRSHSNFAFPCGYNGTYIFEGQANAEYSPFMRIGVNGPWDSNPFFFSISRGEWDSMYYDDLYPDLHGFEFWSANFECFREGAPCEDLKNFDQHQWEWIPLQQVDLNAASIVRESDSNNLSRRVDPVPFYSVTGDSRTWVGNGTVSRNRALFKAGKSMVKHDLRDNCVQDLNINWGPDTNFTYNLMFNADMAVATFNITVPDGVLSIDFQGTQERLLDDPMVGPLLHSDHVATLADPANYSMPRFRNPDLGGEFVWATDLQGRWHAKAATAAGAALSQGGCAVGMVTVVASIVACLLLI